MTGLYIDDHRVISPRVWRTILVNDKHRNDIYGDNPHGDSASSPAIPAATVVLLRESKTGIETLMLHRTSKVSFGGMWVFPGGRIDPEDHEGTDSELGAAYHAAARETLEETKLSVDPDAFAYFAHWTPPPGTPKRYSTYFFASQLPNETSIEVDGEEIQGHAWMSPSRALERHAAGEIDLAPPTWVTLYQLSRHAPLSSLMKTLTEQTVRIYETHITTDEDGTRIALWSGDAGYESMDPNAPGGRHRLLMQPGGFTFEHSDLDY